MNLPKRDPRREAHLRRRWRHDALAAVKRFPAFLGYEKRFARLGVELRHGVEGWIDDVKVRPMNLLPPSLKCGAWDRAWARDVAAEVAADAFDRRCDVRMILCGRNVADAFLLKDLEFGEVGESRGVLCIVLPHPSGRNQWFNEEGSHDAWRRTATSFATMEV